MKINTMTLYKIIEVNIIIFIFMSLLFSNTIAYRFFCTCTRTRKNTRVVPVKTEILPSTAEALNGQSIKKSTPTVIKGPETCLTDSCVHAGNKTHYLN